MTARITVTACDAALGADIAGVDLSGPLDDDMVAAIRAALLDHGVIFFRDQTLDPASLTTLARHFGEPLEYPFVKGVPGHPLVTPVVKEADDTVNFGGVWHSDNAYMARPAMATMLYAVETPPAAGDTLFADQRLAFETLPYDTRRRIEGLRALNASDKPDVSATRTAMIRSQGAGRRAPLNASHPVVRTHPETGRRSLYVNLAHTVAIEGLDEAESAALLETLFRHQVRDDFVVRFRWRPGSLAFWDNRATLHFPMNDYHGHRRAMLRVTLAGDAPR